MNRVLYQHSHNDWKIILFDSTIPPVDKTSITKCLWFALISIEYQNDFTIGGFNLLRKRLLCCFIWFCFTRLMIIIKTKYFYLCIWLNDVDLVGSIILNWIIRFQIFLGWWLNLILWKDLNQSQFWFCS